MRYELIVDNEWIYEGTYEQVERMATTYWDDCENMYDVRIIDENEFWYGKSK